MLLFGGAQSEGKGIKVKMSEHVSDVRGFLHTFLPGKSPVIVGHRWDALETETFGALQGGGGGGR